jgi:hypothetical protein
MVWGEKRVHKAHFLLSRFLFPFMITFDAEAVMTSGTGTASPGREKKDDV